MQCMEQCMQEQEVQRNGSMGMRGQTLLRKQIMVRSLTFLASMAAVTISTSPPCSFRSFSTSSSARSLPSNRIESSSSTSPSPSPLVRTAARQAISTASARSPISHTFSTAYRQYCIFSWQNPSSYCSLARCLRVAADTFPDTRLSALSREDSAKGKSPDCRASSASKACSETTFSGVARNKFCSVVCLARARKRRAVGGSVRRCRRERSRRTSRYCLLAVPKCLRQSCSACRRSAAAALVSADSLWGLLWASLAQQQAAREQRAARLECPSPQLYSMSSVALRRARVKSVSENSEQAFIMRRQTANSRVYFCGQASSQSLHLRMQPMKSPSQQWKQASSYSSSSVRARGSSPRRWQTSFFRVSAASARGCRPYRYCANFPKDSTSSSSPNGYSRTMGTTLQAKKMSFCFLGLALGVAVEARTAFSSTSSVAPKQCSMKEKSCPVRRGGEGQLACSSSGAMAASPLNTRLKKCVSSISPCADRYTRRRCLQNRQFSSAVMISSFGQLPCRPFAARSPFTYFSIDSRLVEAFSFLAQSRKARSMGESKTMLWFFSGPAARHMRLRCSLTPSSSRSTPFPRTRTCSDRKPPIVLKLNHSERKPSSCSTLRSNAHSSPQRLTPSRPSTREKAMQQTPLYSRQTASGTRRLSAESCFNRRMSILARHWYTLNSLFRFLSGSSLKNSRGRLLIRMVWVLGTATRSSTEPTSTTFPWFGCSLVRQRLSPLPLESIHSASAAVASALKDSQREMSSFWRSRRQSNFEAARQLSPNSHQKSHPGGFWRELMESLSSWRCLSLMRDLSRSASLSIVASSDFVSRLERGVKELSADILLLLSSWRSSTISRGGTMASGISGGQSKRGDSYSSLCVSEKSFKSLRVFSIDALRSVWGSESEQLSSLSGVCIMEGYSTTSSIEGGGGLMAGLIEGEGCGFGGSSFLT